MQSGHGDGGKGHDEPTVLVVDPLSDDELRAELRRILETDPDCPIPKRARTHGTLDPTLLWEMTGYLFVAVGSPSRKSVYLLHAYCIVRDELEIRFHQGALD